VVEQAAGHPFYLEELIRAAAEGHGNVPPGTVLAMVQARLEALSPAARRMLRAGSIFGDAFWIGGVRALLGGAATQDEALLDELQEREFVRRRASRFPGEWEICFRHALVREAAYAMLTPADLATGHRLAGAWLEQAGERDAARLAEHFESGAEPARAARWYQRAAEQALEANDLEAVIIRAHRAAELGAEGQVLGAALLALGEAHLWRSEGAEAGPPLTEAMRLLPPGSAPWFRAAMGAAWAAANDADRIRAVAAEIAQWLGPSPSGASLVAAARVANQFILLGLYQEAEPFAKVLAPMRVDPATDPVVAASAHDLAVFEAVIDGDLGTASVSASTSALRFDEAGDVRSAVRLRGNAGDVLAQLGLFEQAEAELRAALAAAERLGIHHAAAWVRQSLGGVLLRRRAFAEARALVEQSISALAGADHRGEAFSRGYLSAILLDTGDLDGAQEEASRAIGLCEDVPSTRCVALATLARVLLARGLPSKALWAAEEAIELLEQLGGIDDGESLIRLTFAEALVAAGEHARAAAAIASARTRLLARAARIADLSWRRSFLEAVPENARTLALADELATAPREGSTM